MATLVLLFYLNFGTMFVYFEDEKWNAFEICRLVI